MKTTEIKINIQHLNIEELTKDELQLVEKAKKATENAYAKYSNFHVGAALLLNNGEIVIGANQENAAYPSGLCAERSAIFAAQSQKPNQSIKAIAIAAYNENGFLKQPITPCGACRQVMLEIEERYKTPIIVYLYGTEGILKINNIKSLLPLSFVEDSLKG